MTDDPSEFLRAELAEIAAVMTVEQRLLTSAYLRRTALLRWGHVIHGLSYRRLGQLAQVSWSSVAHALGQPTAPVSAVEERYVAWLQERDGDG